MAEAFDWMMDPFDDEVNMSLKKVKTEEEIKKFMTRDGLSEITRAIILLKKGYGVQKTSVINHLYKYLQEEGNKEELLMIIIESMIDWDEVMQLEWATSFIKPLEMKLIDTEIIKNLVHKVITMIFELEDNDNLIKAWCQVFILWVPQCDLDFLIDEVVPILFPMTSITEKKLIRRLLSGEMLLEIWWIYGEKAFEKEKKLAAISLYLCDDIINWKMRKLGANRLKRILPVSTQYIKEHPDYYQMLIEKFQELLWDEENFVKIDAFESILRSLKYIKKEDFRDKLVPVIKEIFEKEVNEHEELQYSMASVCGEFMYEIKIHEHDSSLNELITLFFESLINDENEELRKKAAYNFPFFFTELYMEDDIESVESNDEEVKCLIAKSKWVEYIDKLVHDNCEDIRVTIAASFKDIWVKVIEVNKSLGFWKKIIFEFMQDNNELIIKAMVQHLEIFIQMFEHETAVEEWEDVEILNEDENELKNEDQTPKGNFILIF